MTLKAVLALAGSVMAVALPVIAALALMAGNGSILASMIETQMIGAFLAVLGITGGLATVATFFIKATTD